MEKKLRGAANDYAGPLRSASQSLRGLGGDEAGGRGLPSLPLGLGRGKWRNVREAFVAPRSLVAAQRCRGCPP